MNALGQLRGLDLTLLREAFYIFQAERFKNWNSFNT